jgi:hypothetical protein
MALRMGALYDALILAKVPAAEAQRAAEEVATYEQGMNTIKAEFAIVKWMLGTVLVVVLAILGRLLFIH